MTAVLRASNEPNLGPRPMTPDQVADHLQLSRQTIMRAIRNGELQASQFAERGCWRIWPDAVEEWLRLRSERARRPVPLADVSAIGSGAGAAERARRQGAGGLRVEPGMGRDNQ